VLADITQIDEHDVVAAMQFHGLLDRQGLDLALSRFHEIADMGGDFLRHCALHYREMVTKQRRRSRRFVKGKSHWRCRERPRDRVESSRI
jgi:hypothetical protein